MKTDKITEEEKVAGGTVLLGLLAYRFWPDSGTGQTPPRATNDDDDDNDDNSRALELYWTGALEAFLSAGALLGSLSSVLTLFWTGAILDGRAPGKKLFWTGAPSGRSSDRCLAFLGLSGVSGFVRSVGCSAKTAVVEAGIVDGLLPALVLAALAERTPTWNDGVCSALESRIRPHSAELRPASTSPTAGTGSLQDIIDRVTVRAGPARWRSRALLGFHCSDDTRSCCREDRELS